MDSLITKAITWVIDNPQIDAAVVSGALALSVALESFLTTLRRKFVNFTKKPIFKKIAFTLIHVISALTAAGTYWLGHVPKHDVLPIFAALTIIAQAWHMFAVSGFFTKVAIPFLDYLAGQKPAPAVAPTEATPPDTFAA